MSKHLPLYESPRHLLGELRETDARSGAISVGGTLGIGTVSKSCLHC